MGQIQSVGDFLSMLRRRSALIMAVVLLGTLFSIWWALGQVRIYEATSVAQIESPTVTEPGVTVPNAGTSVEHRLRLLEQQLMARDNLIALIEKYDLYGGTDLSQNLKVSTLRESARIVQLTDPTAGFGAARAPTGMMITVSYSDARTAAALANDFLDQLVSLNRQRRSSAASQNLAFYQAETARIEAEMAALDARIAAFKEKNAAFLPAGIAAQRDELGTLKNTLLELDQKLIELDASRSRQRTSVIERQTALLQEQQSLIKQRIAEIEAAIASAPEVDRQFGALNRELEQLRDRYGVIARQATEAEMGQTLESQQQFERIEVLETALVPENPVSGSRKKKVAIGAFLSAFLGIGLALLLEVMNPVIRTRQQLERQLDVKPVVAIPHLTTSAQRRRRNLIWVAAATAILAGLSVGWALLRDIVGQAVHSVAGKPDRAQG